MAIENLTAEELRRLLDYDSKTGEFRWRTNIGSRARAGQIAGNRRRDGYVQLMVNGKNYRAHRLAWLHFHGIWPTGVIDHIDGNPANNRLANLRDVTQTMNLMNQHGPRSDNAVRMLGVCRNRARWRATIQVNGQWKHLGTFDTPEEAHAVYLCEKAHILNAPTPTE